MTLEPLQYLMNVDAIKSLKARYFRCLDTKDWDGWLDVFTDDVVLSFDTAVSTGTSARFSNRGCSRPRLAAPAAAASSTQPAATIRRYPIDLITI